MKQVEIYDQYSEVYDGTTLVHGGSGFTLVKGTFDNLEDAKSSVENLYNSSKLLGSYEDKYVNFDRGYAELKINFADGRKLNRVIYIIDK